MFWDDLSFFFFTVIVWWFQPWNFIFHFIYGMSSFPWDVILPIDELIFFKMVIAPPTSCVFKLFKFDCHTMNFKKLLIIPYHDSGCYIGSKFTVCSCTNEISRNWLYILPLLLPTIESLSLNGLWPYTLLCNSFLALGEGLQHISRGSTNHQMSWEIDRNIKGDWWIYPPLLRQITLWNGSPLLDQTRVFINQKTR